MLHRLVPSNWTVRYDYYESHIKDIKSEGPALPYEYGGRDRTPRIIKKNII